MRRFADIHCHPSFKSYGKSFPDKINDSNPCSKKSIWCYDPQNILEKMIDLIGGIVKYRQSNLSAMGFGNTGIVFASLYPIERGFFDNNLDSELIKDLMLNFVTSLGKERIDYIQSITDYFPDLEGEYDFIKQLDKKIIKLADNAQYRYSIAKDSTDLDLILNQDTSDNLKANSIAIIITIEGAHVFGTGINPENKPANRQYVLGNVDKVKKWEHRPFFITLAHHFYNELCGHAQSLTGVVKKVADQSYGMNQGFTKLGLDVLDKLLDDSDNNRVLIDIKHMSRNSRLEYFNLLDTKYKNENIPVIISHGAVMGNEKNRHLFLQDDINFYDDEILKVAETDGLFGIQLDERRIVAAGDYELKKSHGLSRRKVLFHSSFLIWRQIQHIAELLDSNGYFAWGIQTIGSDYDGMIDPLNGFWTAEDYPALSDYLLKHAFNYMQDSASKINQSINKIDPEEIVDRIMGDNAYQFLKKYYK